MRGFGIAFGNAFQVADDLLDLAASQEDLGKPPGTDVRDGVYTLPIILACAADPSLIEKLGTPEVDVDFVKQVTVATGAFERSREIAVAYVNEALGYLEKTPQGEARETLSNLTRLVVDRVPVLA